MPKGEATDRQTDSQKLNTGERESYRKTDRQRDIIEGGERWQKADRQYGNNNNPFVVLSFFIAERV